MIKVILFLILTTFSFSNNKFIVPTLSKNEHKQLIITLKPKMKHYIIKQGDTLKSVAEKFQMNIDELIRRNKLDKEKDLKVGMVILVDEVENS